MKKSLLYIVITLLLSVAVHAQDDARIKPLADKACECLAKIDGDTSKEKIIDEINSCIEGTSLMQQLTDVNTQSEAAKKSGDTSKKEYTITYGDNFKEVQAYMYKNCPLLQTLMAASTGQALSQNKKAMEYYNEARAYTNEQKYDMAVVSYNKAIKADPKFATAYDYMGINYRRLNNYKEAINCYNKSLAINPNGELPLQNTAIAYELLNDNKQAAATYEKFIALHPDNPEGYYGAARTFYTLEDYEKGTDNIFKAYKLYNLQKSPYVNDALDTLKFYYKDLKEKNKLDVFNQAAKNNNINLKG